MLTIYRDSIIIRNRHLGRWPLLGHVTKHPLLFSFHHFELQPCLKVMSTEVRFVKFIGWSKLVIYHFEAECLHLNAFGWRRNDFCSWWIVLCWNCKELGLRATWTNERGGKISKVTCEILGMNCTLKGSWWVNGYFVQLTYCQATQAFILLCFARMESSRWCVIVIFQPLDAIKTSKTSYKDVSGFGFLIFANGSWEARPKIDLIVFQMRNLVK